LLPLLCAVLAAVPDGHLRLDDAHWVLADALMLLACKEIKLSAGSAGAAEDADDGEAATAGAAANAAKSRLLTAVAKKAAVESIVPIVIELKRHLESVRSPLLKDVFLFLREVRRARPIDPAPNQRRTNPLTHPPTLSPTNPLTHQPSHPPTLSPTNPIPQLPADCCRRVRRRV
jgi:hypothetical protein